MYRIWPSYIQVCKLHWRSVNLIVINIMVSSYIALLIIFLHLLLYNYVLFPVLEGWSRNMSTVCVRDVV